jgi:hypothetical protein
MRQLRTRSSYRDNFFSPRVSHAFLGANGKTISHIRWVQDCLKCVPVWTAFDRNNCAIDRGNNEWNEVSKSVGVEHGGGFGCAVTSLVPAAGTVLKKINATIKTEYFFKDINCTASIYRVYKDKLQNCPLNQFEGIFTVRYKWNWKICI